MTPADWLSSNDPEALLRFAAPLIPREHLALVLADIAEATASSWYVRYPRDWRLAWAVAALRAWCFGHASDEELARARDLVLDVHDRPASASQADQAARAAATCIISCASVPLQRPASSFAHPDALQRMGLPDLLGGAVHFASLASQHALEGDASSFRASQGHLAELIRKLISYPTRPDEEWVATPGLVFAGEAMLRIDGRKIGDVVRREDFTGLSAERAVAFDAAQQNPSSETPLPSGYRAHLERLAEQLAAPRARPSGCVMSAIIVDGRNVGTRISCYGHEPEAPANIEKDDPRGLPSR